MREMGEMKEHCRYTKRDLDREFKRGASRGRELQKHEDISEFLPIIKSTRNLAIIMLSHSKKSRKMELHNTIEDLIEENMEGLKASMEYELEKWEAELKDISS